MITYAIRLFLLKQRLCTVYANSFNSLYFTNSSVIFRAFSILTIAKWSTNRKRCGKVNCFEAANNSLDLIPRKEFSFISTSEEIIFLVSVLT